MTESSEPKEDVAKSLSDAREAYYYHTKTLSSIVRYLALATIGVVWVFRSETGQGGIELSTVLIWAAICSVLSLAFDIVHYSYSSAVWGIVSRNIENQIHDGEPVALWDRKLNWVSNFCFWSKAMLAFIACILIIIHFANLIL